MFETGMSALVLKICSEYAKALGLNFPPCVQQEINAIAQYVDLHTVKDLKVEQNGSVVTITCFTEGGQEKVFTITLPVPEVNVDVLFNLIKGSSSVVVDKSEDGTYLVVRLDKSQEVNVDVLFNLIKGSSSVVVDKSEDGTYLDVRLDKSQEVQYVELTPASATQGILTDTQWNILQANKGNCIIRNNEIYRLADNQNVNGLITYVHTGWDNEGREDKSISIVVSTKAWTLVIPESGGGLYLHSIFFEGERNQPLLTFYHTSPTEVTDDWIYDHLTNNRYCLTFFPDISYFQFGIFGLSAQLVQTSSAPSWGAPTDFDSTDVTPLSVLQATRYLITEV